MYNKVLKNYQINNLTTPYKIVPVFKKVEEVIKIKADPEDREDDEESEEESEANIQKTVEDIIDEAKENARLMIQEAQLESEKLLTAAGNEVEEIKTHAFENAYKEGFKEASKNAEEKYFSVIEEANAIRKSSVEEYEKVMLGAEKDVVNLAIAIAKKVVGMELRTNADMILSLVRDGLKRTTEKKDITIKVSQEDFRILNEQIYSIIGRETGLTDVDLKQNIALEKGDVIIETPYGIIDGSVDKKMDNLEESFNEFIRKNEEDEVKED